LIVAEPRTCPVDGCTEALRHDDDILCRAHWFVVPQDLRDEVMSTRKRMREPGSNTRWRRLKHNAHMLACANAIKAAGREPEDPADQPA
jgi:hypothetical protein